MKKAGRKLALIIIAIVIAAVYYYVTIPAINIHASGFWIFMGMTVLVLTGIYALSRLHTQSDIRSSKGVKAGIAVLLVVMAVYLVGSVLSSPIINANKYQKLITVEKRNFTEDIKEVDYHQIPLLDRDSATLLGNRKMFMR